MQRSGGFATSEPLAPELGGEASLGERVRSLRLPESGATGRRSSGLVWAAIVLILLLGAGLGYALYRLNNQPPPTGSNADKAAGESGSAAPGAPAAMPAPVAASGSVVLESKGYVIPAHQILVSPKVSGMVIELHIEEGRRVKKGEVLAVLESVDYAADLERASSQLAGAKERLAELEHGFRPEEIAQAAAELSEATAQRDLMRSEWDRQQELKKAKASTDRDFKKAESEFKMMERRVERLKFVHDLMVEGPRKERIAAAKAEVAQYVAEVTKARWRLDNCTIRAPISGTILKKNAEEGNIVNPIAFNGSFSLCDMADLSDLEVDLSIQERDVSRVKVGQKCQVRSEAFPERVYQGVVSRLMPIADRAKGAIPVRVKLTVPAAEEGVYLKPEMSAVVSFLKTDK